MINTTIVRIAVAKLEFILSIPIFARMDVSAAKKADKSAKIIHILLSPLDFNILNTSIKLDLYQDNYNLYE